MRSAPFSEPDPFKRVLGPSFAGKRPNIDQTQIYISVPIMTASKFRVAFETTVANMVLRSMPPSRPARKVRQQKQKTKNTSNKKGSAAGARAWPADHHIIVPVTENFRVAQR